MTKPRLFYFDAPVSRGEECRLAFFIAGAEFEDVRVKQAEWQALKPKTPFGSLPVLEIEGRPPLAESNAILVHIGRRHGLHPKDDFEAARHEMMMCHVEDLRAVVGPTLRMPDDQKKKAREEIVAGYLPTWAANAEKQIGEGPFFGGSAIHVVDLKLYAIVRWFRGGKVDHIPATIFAPYPKLNRVHDAVVEHPRVKAWYART